MMRRLGGQTGARSARRGSRLRSAVLVAAALATTGLKPGPALAQAEPWPAAPLELRVRYAAPAGCPSGAEFLAALQGHLAAGGGGAIDAVVHITGPEDGGFELVLELLVAGTLTESRTRDESCAALMQLAALDASIARTASSDDAGVAAGLAGARAALPSERRPPEPERPGADAGAPFDTAADEAAASGPAATLRGFALAEMRAASGMLPGAAWGQGLALGVSLGPWSLRSSGTWWLPEQFVYEGDGGSPIPLRFEQQSLELAPCAGQALSALLRLEGCVGLSAHRTQASDAEADVWAALSGAVLAVLHPWRGLRVEAAAQLLVPLSAPSFGVESLEDVYSARAVQPGARLAVGWELGSSAPPAPAPLPTLRASSEARAGRAP